MAIAEDPYFAGRLSEKSVPGKQPGEKPPLIAWIGVYAVNLILPLNLGLMLTRDAGRLGMMVAIILLFALGCRICFVSRRAVLTVVYGGWIVAASQSYPLLQIIAGSMSIAMARVLGQGTGDVSSELGGFIATIVTGVLLITVATVFGLVIQGIISGYNRKTVARATAREAGV